MTTIEINCSNFVPSAYDELFDSVLDHGHTHYWFKGGRGSVKSTMAAFCIVLLTISNRFYNAVVLRKVAQTLRHSAFAQVQWVINKMGLQNLFRPYKSPLSYTYLPTGQQILFSGTDDPQKLRSLVFPNGYPALVWFEELPDFDSMEEIHDITLSLIRGGDKYWFFYTYNPPKTAWNWINREALAREQRADTLVHHSTYLDIIDEHPDWLGQPFLDDAEYTRVSNPMAYRWEFLGEVTGTGGTVFENLKSIIVPTKEIYNFERIHNGVDFGWFPDPWTLVRAEYQPSDRRIIIFEEHEAIKMLPEQTGEIIRQALTYKDKPDDAEPVYHHEIVWCDDTADGKAQMAAYRRKLGLNARPAPKGNMRKQSYYWLAGLREIVIDPKRCPRAYEEFALCEYKKDRHGDWIDDFNDGNDHFIDATRYAFMDTIVRSR